MSKRTLPTAMLALVVAPWRWQGAAAKGRRTSGTSSSSKEGSTSTTTTTTHKKPDSKSNGY